MSCDTEDVVLTDNRETRGTDGRSSMGIADWFVLLACLISLVNDGWSGRPYPLLHQLLLIPLELLFAFLAFHLLQSKRHGEGPVGGVRVRKSWLYVLAVFEFTSLLGMWYQARHFARFGYHLPVVEFLPVMLVIVTAAMSCGRWRSATWLIGMISGVYGVGALVAIFCFPLNYLRSDMLPVISWANQRLAAHLNPYVTMHVGTRLYDFPYLPGMLVSYLPIIAVHKDPRWLNLGCILAIVVLLYTAAVPPQRRTAAVLIGIFVLSPFLQYRHELYLEPHWLMLSLTIVLLQRGRYYWAAASFGVSMAIYQLSWVLWPFLLLYALRRRGWGEVLREAAISLGAMAVVVGPFLSSALGRIAQNTVGQWSRMPHALAEPLNLSYWVTYLVRPDELRWVQLGVLTTLFAFCIVKGRCQTLSDTLRWMSAALAIFIALNVLVDGYFYLTLLLLMLMYTMAATGIWKGAALNESIPSRRLPASASRTLRAGV